MSAFLVRCLCLVSVCFAATAISANPRVAEEGASKHPVSVSKGTHAASGTLQYDNDVAFARSGQDDGSIGNIFGTTGTTYALTSIEFAMAGNYISAGTVGSVVLSVWDVGGGAANILSRAILTDVPGGVFGGTGPIGTSRLAFTFASPINSIDGTFFVGFRNTFYDGCAGNTNLGSTCDGVAITEGTGAIVPGRGRALQFTGPFDPTAVTALTTSGAPLPGNVNAIIRATGDNLPVELMSFDIE